MRILITGSSGLIGSALVSHLSKQNHEIYKLVRENPTPSQKEILWRSDQGVQDLSLLEGMDGVIHLAGEGIMGLWTETKKRRIWESRVQGTTVLCQQLSQLKRPPHFFMGASAVGYYGERGEEILTEESPKGMGFLADLSQKWEEASKSIADRGVRTLHLRFGAVLSPQGGILKALLPLFKAGLGGCLGSGRQYLSWIALQDVLRAIDFLIGRSEVTGPLNCVAPHPVTNREFTRALGEALHRPTFLNIPAFAIKLLPGEMAKEFLLVSERVIPKRLEEEGFLFETPYLENWTSDILRGR